MEKVASFGSRLHQVMAEQGFTYMALGERLNMKPQTLNRYVLDQREPKATITTAMALALGVDSMWLQGYDVGQYGPDSQELGRVVPILTALRPGMPLPEDVEGYATVDVLQPKEYFYFRVTGNSMQGAGIRNRDLILIHKQAAAKSGQIVACVLNGKESGLRRLYRQEELLIFQPEDPSYEPYIFQENALATDAIQIVGVAVKLMRNL